jgi:hypothetical protein
MKKTSTRPEQGDRPRRTSPPEALFNASLSRANASVVELLINERRAGPLKFWDASAIGPLLVEEAMTLEQTPVLS